MNTRDKNSILKFFAMPEEKDMQDIKWARMILKALDRRYPNSVASVSLSTGKYILKKRLFKD